MAYWLMKSEPATWSWAQQKAEGRTGTEWDGVRNFQARNYLREMRKGDLVFFYHSSTAVPAIVGLAEVASLPYPDPTQFKKRSPYFDPKSTPEEPRWQLVDVRFVRKFAQPVTLEAMRQVDALEGFALLQRGNRLSVLPVTAPQFKTILTLEKG